jgi:hypothetical protein
MSRRGTDRHRYLLLIVLLDRLLCCVHEIPNDKLRNLSEGKGSIQLTSLLVWLVLKLGNPRRSHITVDFLVSMVCLVRQENIFLVIKRGGNKCGVWLAIDLLKKLTKWRVGDHRHLRKID